MRRPNRPYTCSQVGRGLLLTLRLCCAGSADTGQLEVGKRSLGHFSSQTKAFKKCEDMIKVVKQPVGPGRAPRP